jgi:hypothetical protein
MGLSIIRLIVSSMSPFIGYHVLHANSVKLIKVKFARMKLLSSGTLRRVVWKNFTNVSHVLPASIIRAMNNTRCRENQKFHEFVNLYMQ